jgi:hypothetical protein
MSNAANQVVSWKQRFRHELLAYWLTVAYLAFYFGVFTMYRRLILAQYQIAYLNYGFAVIQALVLAKVILVGDMLRLGRGLEHRPLIFPTLFRSVLFTGWTAVFSFLEHTVTGLLRGQGLAGGLHAFVNKDEYEFLASCLVVFFTFIPFFALKELNRVLGQGKVWGLFFRSRAATESGPDSGSNREQPADATGRLTGITPGEPRR